MPQANTQQVGISAELLDAAFYLPLQQQLAQTPYPPEFERLDEPKLNRIGIDVLLIEGLRLSNISEIASRVPDAKSFFFEVSRLRHEVVESGWLLDEDRPTDFFLLHYMEAAGEGPISFRVLLVPKNRLIRTLVSLGCDRKMLGHREMVIREAGRPGLFRTAHPSLSLYYNINLPSKPVSLLVGTDILARIATADIHAAYDSESGTSTLRGHWVNQILN